MISQYDWGHIGWKDSFSVAQICPRAWHIWVTPTRLAAPVGGAFPGRGKAPANARGLTVDGRTRPSASDVGRAAGQEARVPVYLMGGAMGRLTLMVPLMASLFSTCPLMEAL